MAWQIWCSEADLVDQLVTVYCTVNVINANQADYALRFLLEEWPMHSALSMDISKNTCVFAVHDADTCAVSLKERTRVWAMVGNTVLHSSPDAASHLCFSVRTDKDLLVSAL